MMLYLELSQYINFAIAYEFSQIGKLDTQLLGQTSRVMMYKLWEG